MQILALFLYDGRRWQARLARELGVSYGHIKRWKLGSRPLSRTASRKITTMVREKHARQMARAWRSYVHMIDSLTSPGILAQLQVIDLTDVRETLAHAATDPHPISLAKKKTAASAAVSFQLERLRANVHEIASLTKRSRILLERSRTLRSARNQGR